MLERGVASSDAGSNLCGGITLADGRDLGIQLHSDDVDQVTAKVKVVRVWLLS